MPATVREVIDALAAFNRANEAEEDAHAVRCRAQIRLAELVGTQRRDRDTGFEAEFDAKDLIVKAALAGELVPSEGAE